MARGWLSKLLGTGEPAPKRSSGPPPVPLAVGERIYAIGDLHGRSDLLDEMHGAILRDTVDHPVRAMELVYLGDYVDRGADSAGVLGRLAAPAPGLPRARALMGNHEAVMRDFLAGGEDAEAWREFGGFETMRSYGVDPTAIPGRHWAAPAREQLEYAMPRSHRALLDALERSYDRPPYFFCHAGVRPGVPVEMQDAHDLIWIRKDFLRSDADFGRVVVHGHTPVSRPDVRANRINVDTGAYATGRLTCAVLEVGSVRVLQTGGS